MIRAATPADIPAIMALEQLAPSAAHWSPSQYQAMFSPAPPRVVLLSEEQGTIQAFLIARGVGSEWEIENIVVAAPARRRGLATALLGEFLNLARSRGASAVFLEVRESNMAARCLYQAWAFVESGRREAYYRDPQEAAITLLLDLSCLHQI